MRRLNVVGKASIEDENAMNRLPFIQPFQYLRDRPALHSACRKR